MKVRDAMTPHQECVGPNDRAAKATSVMNTTKAQTLPALDHCQVSGTVGKEEVEKTVAEVGRAPGLLTVREVMKENSSRAMEDEDLDVAEERMRKAGLMVIPVVNREQRIVGMLRRRS